MRGFAVTCYIAAIIFIGLAFDRMFSYEYSEVTPETNVNVWVGGDAYNYIINGTHATSFMILSLIFVIIGLALEILIRIDIKTTTLRNSLKLNDELEKEKVEEDEKFKGQGI